MKKVESRTFLQKHEVAAICEATTVSSLAQRLLINFYFRIKNHKHPSKAFTDRNKALEWANCF
jgi:hypothetical protein